MTASLLQRLTAATTLPLLLAACAPDPDVPSPSAGALDPNRYVAVGDSYTAGLANGGLSDSSQAYAYPALLARQLARVGGPSPDAFVQTLLAAGTRTDYLALRGLDAASGLPLTRRVRGNAVRGRLPNPNACGGPDTTLLLARSANAGQGLPQNLGVPGLRLTQVGTPNYGNEATAQTLPANFNAYFERLLPAADSRTYRRAVTQASRGATFFTFFAGLDDLLPYVRSGGECPLASNTLTFMNANARVLLDTLRAGGRPGAVALLPDLNTLPLLRQGAIVVPNRAADGLEARLQAARRDTSVHVYVFDPVLQRTRRADPGDYVLPAGLLRLGQAVAVGGASVPYGLDPRAPVAAREVFDYDEYNRVNAVLTSYNNNLSGLATGYNLPVVRVAAEFTIPVADRIALAGVVYSAAPVRGGVYSLDYYSLTPRGQGLLANAFIRALNQAYKANIPAVDVNSLPGLK